VDKIKKNKKLKKAVANPWIIGP